MGEYEEGDNTSGVIWNFDDAESKLIFTLKLDFIKYRDAWDLEGAYWALLRLLSETEAMFDDTIKDDINQEFDSISQQRTDKGNFIKIDESEKGEHFVQLNALYRKLCSEMVEKSYYFRKKKEYLGL